MRFRHLAPLLGWGLWFCPWPAWAQALTREEAVQLALAHNPGIIAARQSWEAARAAVWPARLLPDPELSLEYETLPKALSLGQYGERNLGVRQILEAPTKPWLRGRLAAAAAQVAQSEYEALRLEVSAEVEKTCARIWAGQRRCEYAAEDLRLAAEFRDKTRLRAQVGDVPQVEVLRAEVEVGRAEAGQALAQRQLRLDQTALNALLGRDLGAAVDLAGELDFQPVGAELATLRQQALARRPDLQRAGAQVAGAQAGQRLATSALLPDLSVAVSRQQLRGEGDYWKTGLSLAVPLWALGRQRGEISRAGSELGRARAEQLQARNRALLEVEQAYQEVKAAEEQVRLYRDRVLPNAEETYRVFRRRYDEGRSGYLEVIDAGRTLAESRAAATEALLIYHTAAADLNRAVGGSSADYQRGEAR